MTREQLSKLLTETDVYVKYGLHDKALEHLRKIFSIDPENLDAHEKAYNIYVAAGNTVQASEQLLNVLRLCTRRTEAQRAQPYLNIILQENPNHPEVPAFLAVLRTEQTGAQVAAPVESLGEDAILVDSNDEEIVVAEPPEDALAQPPGDELALATISSGDSDEVIDDGSGEAVVSDEAVVGEAIVSGESELYSSEDATSLAVAAADEALSEDEGLVIGDEPTSTNLLDEPLMAGASEDEGFEEAPSAEYVVDEPIVGGTDEGLADEPMAGDEGLALGDDEPPPTRPAMPSAQLLQHASTRTGSHAALGEDDDMPTRVSMSPLGADEPEITSAGHPAYTEEEPEEATTVVGAVLAVEPPAEEQYAAEYQEPTGEAAAEDDPAAEECDEAGFFVDQGLYDEAREILENVLIAIPGHPRATELMARVEAGEAGGVATTEETEAAEAAAVPSVQPVVEEGERDAFDLAAELAGEIDGLGDSAPAPAAEDDFQYSVEEVFAEFKKGLEKVVKPEDVDTHYDLGIAYKEMGLSDDALGEFAVARKGCMGKPREVDCITMIGMLHGMRGEHAEAVKVFKEGLASEHAVGEVAKALGFELALAYEALGQNGKALYHYQRVAKLDAKYRDVSSQVSRLAGSTAPEEDPLPPAGAAAVPPPAAAAGAPKARKVGYV
jgi:pilus assembly protein FimV